MNPGLRRLTANRGNETAFNQTLELRPVTLLLIQRIKNGARVWICGSQFDHRTAHPSDVDVVISSARGALMICDRFENSSLKRRGLVDSGICKARRTDGRYPQRSPNSSFLAGIHFPLQVRDGFDGLVRAYSTSIRSPPTSNCIIEKPATGIAMAMRVRMTMNSEFTLMAFEVLQLATECSMSP